MRRLVLRMLTVAICTAGLTLPAVAASADVTDLSDGTSDAQESLRVNNNIAAMNTYRNL